MCDEPLVSIVIPVYNGSNYMREAIDSALCQTYANCEVIVVNDGSTDETEKIALSYGDRIRYFAKENGGVASALNVAINNMRGEYFSWLSHDDIYYPYKVESQIKMLKQTGNEKAFAYSSWERLVMSDNKVIKHTLDYWYDKKDYENGMLAVLCGLINGCTTLIHKSIFDNVGMFDESLQTSQDYDMWFRILRRTPCVYIDEPLVKYREHSNQGSFKIKEYKYNCQEMQLKMMHSLTNDEVIKTFGSYCAFYYNMFDVAYNNEWDIVIQEILRLLDSEKITDTDNKYFEPIYLYCAGKNGKRVKKTLDMLGIDVIGFSDGNSELWGKIVDGKVCYRPDEVDKRKYVVVTKDDPEIIVQKLHNNGFEHVITLKQLKQLISKGQIPLDRGE
jgi:glycosyltransferase involved in cell wall biosynthesis